MMHRSKKWLPIVVPVFLTAVLFSCSKDKGLATDALVGRWQYQNSTYDTSTSGGHSLVTIYDASFPARLGESLEFRKGDTVYYSYLGMTTWCNYAVKGNNLILIGSAGNETMTIYNLTTNKLTIGWEGPDYKANFTR